MLSYAYFLYVGLIGIIVEGFTLLLAFKLRSKPFLKYIPSIIVMLLTLAYCLWISASKDAGGFSGLVIVLVAMIMAPVFAVSVLTAIIIDISRIIKKRNQTKG